MFRELSAAAILLCVTVVVHATGLMEVLRWVLRSPALRNTRFWPHTWLLIRIAGSLIVIHLVEIAVWALFYWAEKCFPNTESAFYFSGVTYTTVGYGDLVLPGNWRLLGPVEGLTGILMCGLSIGLFVAVLSRLYGARIESNNPDTTT
jgi:hypothetical protein